MPGGVPSRRRRILSLWDDPIYIDIVEVMDVVPSIGLNVLVIPITLY